MKQIPLCNQKGGVGKSTLAASLAVAAQEVGETVILLALDPQASIDVWANDRPAEAPAVARVLDAQALQLPAILSKLERDGYTLVILDCQGTDSPLLAEVMKTATLCLIPSRPSNVDIRAARPTLRQILAHKTAFWFVLNQCAPSGSRTAEAASSGRSRRSPWSAGPITKMPSPQGRGSPNMLRAGKQPRKSGNSGNTLIARWEQQVSKRPSLMPSLEEPVAPTTSEPVRTAPTKSKDLHSTTVYMPREPFERLRLMAFTRRKSINALMMEALDAMFEREGNAERFTRK
ncbi:MAG: parA [Hyphomicrobiales bacterium]|nr:parA [Hyphomicrobiales bacterium]